MNNEIGRRLKKLRTHADRTLEDVSTGVGTSKSYLCELEHGKVARVSAAILAKLAKELGTTMDFLYFGEKEETATDEAFYSNYLASPGHIRRKIRGTLAIWEPEWRKV